MASKLAEVEHPVACPPQWLPVLLGAMKPPPAADLGESGRSELADAFGSGSGPAAAAGAAAVGAASKAGPLAKASKKAAVAVRGLAGSVTNQTIKIIVNYMFIHVAKTGGTTFDYMLQKGQLHPLVPCFMDGYSQMHTTICYSKRCRVQTPVQKQACNTGSSEIKSLNLLDIDPNVQLLTILRDPVDHELSMFAHCQTPGAKGQRTHGYPPISFPEYLNFRTAHPENKTFCGYTPFNMQVGKLGGGPDQLEAAIHALKSFYWVGVTGRYEASLCLLRSKLNGQAACSCFKSQEATHITHGTRPDDITLTSMMRRQIHFLAGLDAVLHAHALSRLQQELAQFNMGLAMEVPPTEENKGRAKAVYRAANEKA